MTTLYIVVCGAGPAGDVAHLIHQAQAQDCDCHIIATPAAEPFIDREGLETLTGNPIRYQHRNPGEPRQSRPAADAIIIAPATANTIAKLAAGITDTYALDVVSECLGAGVPVVILPFINAALANRAPFKKAVDDLRHEGVRILLGSKGIHPHPPGTGNSRATDFPWTVALEEAVAAISTP